MSCLLMIVWINAVARLLITGDPFRVLGLLVGAAAINRRLLRSRIEDQAFFPDGSHCMAMCVADPAEQVGIFSIPKTQRPLRETLLGKEENCFAQGKPLCALRSSAVNSFAPWRLRGSKNITAVNTSCQPQADISHHIHSGRRPACHRSFQVPPANTGKNGVPIHRTQMA